MALPSSSLIRCETVQNESVESLVSKLPDALEVDAQTVSDGFRECSIEISSSAVPLQDLPTLPDALDVDEEILSDRIQECSIEMSSLAAPMTDVSSGNPQPFQDATTGLLEVECNTIANVSSFSVSLPELSDVTQQNYRTTEEREKTRRFPVLLSGEESTVHVSNSKVPARFSSSRIGGGARDDGPGVGNGLESCKESASESEGEDCKAACSSEAMDLLFTRSKHNSLEKDEPLQGILWSKIAELEVAGIGPFKIEDDDSKSVRARKRRLKEVRALLEGTDRCADEKLRLLNNKYLQQVADTRQMEKDYLALNRKCKQVNKEKETLHSELTKSTALRQKLESLCRELQRQNKMFLDESKRVASEEEKKRQELSTKFHDTVKDITAKLEQQGEDRLRQLEENELLHEKLKHFTQQYEIREQHFDHQLRTKSLEQQLLEVKLKQQEDLSAQAETKSRMYTEQVTQLLKTEQDLRSQLALYGDKFEQFQETLTKSNEVFATFKMELEKMSKTVRKLEKENGSLKKKCEESDISIIELLEERDILKKQLVTTKNQKDKLEGLCRSLQADRKQQAIAQSDASNAHLPSQLVSLPS